MKKEEEEEEERQKAGTGTTEHEKIDGRTHLSRNYILLLIYITRPLQTADLTYGYKPT